MGVWNTFKSSYQQQGIFDSNSPYHPSGFKAAWNAANPGRIRPNEGFLHGVGRGIKDNIIESGYSGTGVLPAGLSGRSVRYGGSIFTPGGMREVMHEAPTALGTTGRFMMGARRGWKGMLGSAAGKLITPGMFLYDVSQVGVGEATKNAVVNGAIFGAARWSLGRIGMGLAHPAVLAAAAVVGTGIAAQKALVMSKRYNEDVRKVSFGNAFNDVYGTAATMRQASLMAMQSSKVNGRNALGSEASLMHMR